MSSSDRADKLNLQHFDEKKLQQMYLCHKLYLKKRLLQKKKIRKFYSYEEFCKQLVEVCNLRAKYGLDPPKEPAKELIQSAPVNTGVDARKSYHASVYRASLQNDASRRSNKHSKVSGIAKGKGEAGEGGSRQRCVQEVTSSTINDRLSVEVEVCNLRAKYRLDPLKEPAKELIQSAPVNTGVDSRKSYHASVYRASLQSSASRRSNKHSKVSGKAKGKGVAGEGVSRQRCVQEVTRSTINDRLSVEKGKNKLWQNEDRLIRPTQGVVINEGMEGKRKRGGHREVDAGGNGKLKGKAIGSSEAPDAQSVDYEFTSISSNSNRVYTTITVNQDEEYWVREVFDAKKMRKNVMQFPANVIDSCLLRQISNIVLLDCDKGEPYYCEIKKREEKKETYLCGAWFDYVRKADLKVGDKLHFVIRYPPVEEILVYVERRAATP